MPSIINATTTNGVAISPDNSGSLQLATNNGTTAVTIDTSQNVGVGITSPSARLHAYDASNGTVIYANSGQTGAFLRFGNSVAQAGYIGYEGSGGNNLTFYTSTTERMRIDSSGNVITGASSATTGDRIVNTITYDGNNGYSGSRTATVWGDSTVRASAQADGGNGQLILGTESDHRTIFITNNTERMRIDSLGSLLLNATSNGYGVTGGIYAPSVYGFTTASAANMFIESGGFMRRSTSSIKYKTDVQDATHGLADVMKLRPVTYKGINDGETVFGGLIAEEVHEAGLTEFVQYADDGSPDALAYGQMVSLCVKAIQEQQAMIETLKTELDTVKAELNTLKNPQVEGTE